MQPTPEGRAVAWGLLIIMGVANVAGYVFDLYQRFWWFDRVLHACTILALTLWLALFVCVRLLDPRADYRLLRALLLASTGIALGALWEVAEWGFDQIAPGDVIKGKHDTIIDIIMDTGGALVAGFLAQRLSRPKVLTGQL